MDRSYYSNHLYLNPRRYERQLSLFGRKVLDNLVKIWAADRKQAQNTYQPRFLPTAPLHQSKNLLTLLSDEPVSCSMSRAAAQAPPPPPHATPIQIPNGSNNIDADQLYFDAVMKYVPPLPASHEPFKTVATPEPTNNSKTETVTSVTNRHSVVNVTTYNLITRVQDASEGRNTKHHYPSKPDEGDPLGPGETTQNYNCFPSVGGPKVAWNDMFDTELLSNVATTNAKNMIQQNATNRHNTENIFDIAASSVTNEDYNDDTNQGKINESKLNMKQKSKRKHQQKKPDDVLPKKNKKTNESGKAKINLRKQKFTKTVKNWLDNPNYPSCDEVIPSKINTEEDISKNISDIVVEKNVKNPNKRVVQAQLTNKEGKMKFTKPKSTGSTEIDKADKTNEKTSKNKFMAPIKSPLPVKDVTYDMIILDDTNITEHAGALCLIRSRDLINVLVNGFSQLDDHHTEGKCDPEGFIVNVDERFYYFKGVHQTFRKTIESVLTNNKIICFEGKSLLMYYKSKFDLEIHNLNMFDAKIAGSLLEPENPPENLSDLQKLLSYTPQYTIATECVLQKTAWYATCVRDSSATALKLLREHDLMTVFEEIEMKLLPIIAEMELRGVAVDLQKLKSMEDILLSKMKEVEQQCYQAAGKTFQINSAVQIRNIIYEELQLDTKCNIKIKETIMKGAKSTSETMLRGLVSVHPLPKLILEYRHLHKAHATFLSGIAHQVKDGVVRPTWVQMAAATGRIASNNPNLQAIPKVPFSLVLFPGASTSTNTVMVERLRFRSAYTCRAGCRLVGADFQHVECRVFAHCAADARLLRALQLGGDLFRALAAQWLNKPEDDVTSEDRERTKRIVYASMYGAGCKKLMDILGVSYEQTLGIIASFNRTFPSLKSFGRSVVSRCERSGGRLATLCGRARRFQHIGSAECALRAHAERQAVNYVVQGSAADVCKLAMVECVARVRARSPPLCAALLLQIHDELVWEVAEEHLHTAAGIIKEAMEGCGRRCGMTVALPVAISVGNNWGEMAPYAPPSPPPPLI